MTSQTHAYAVVRALVAAGLLDPGRQDEADAVARSALDGGVSANAPMRRRMAELAGYVGGAFVVGAAVLFVSRSWTDLGLNAQVGLLLGTAALLLAAGAGFVVSAGGRARLRTSEEAVRRRLASVLFTGAAGAVAFGVGLLLGDAMRNEELAVMLAALTAAVVALAGYLVAPTTVGQLGTAVATFTMIPTGLGALDRYDDAGLVPFGLVALALGAVWLVAAERHLWHETLAARLVGCTLAVFGAQLPVFDDPAWIGYAATAAVGATAFWLYVGTRSWPYLATGVVAVTLAVPEALNDWFGGSLGAAGILLAAGVTLLVAALAGLRLRQEVGEDDASGQVHAPAH